MIKSWSVNNERNLRYTAIKRLALEFLEEELDVDFANSTEDDLIKIVDLYFGESFRRVLKTNLCLRAQRN